MIQYTLLLSRAVPLNINKQGDVIGGLEKAGRRLPNHGNSELRIYQKTHFYILKNCQCVHHVAV